MKLQHGSSKLIVRYSVKGLVTFVKSKKPFYCVFVDKIRFGVSWRNLSIPPSAKGIQLECERQFPPPSHHKVCIRGFPDRYLCGSISLDCSVQCIGRESKIVQCGSGGGGIPA